MRTNHKELQMEFDQNGEVVKLQGESHLAEPVLLEGGLRQMVGWGNMAYFCHMTCDPPTTSEETPPEISRALSPFAKVFNEPT